MSNAHFKMQLDAAVSGFINPQAAGLAHFIKENYIPNREVVRKHSPDLFQGALFELVDAAKVLLKIREPLGVLHQGTIVGLGDIPAIKLIRDCLQTIQEAPRGDVWSKDSSRRLLGEVAAIWIKEAAVIEA